MDLERKLRAASEDWHRRLSATKSNRKTKLESLLICEESIDEKDSGPAGAQGKELEREHENPSFKIKALRDEQENRSIRKRGTTPQTARQNQDRKTRGLQVFFIEISQDYIEFIEFTVLPPSFN
jgi:hypothetical protein